MSMTDPIADLLTRIRNACMAQQRTVDVPTSKMKLEILRVLTDQGYLHGFQAVDGVEHPMTRVYIKYHAHQPVLKHMRRISKPGVRRYIKSADIPLVRGGLGIAMLSTSEGIMTGRQARRKNIGGEYLAEIW